MPYPKRLKSLGYVTIKLWFDNKVTWGEKKSTCDVLRPLQFWLNMNSDTSKLLHFIFYTILLEEGSKKMERIQWALFRVPFRKMHGLVIFSSFITAVITINIFKTRCYIFTMTSSPCKLKPAAPASQNKY